MKQLIITTYLVLSGIAAFAQQENKYIHQGNEWYKQGKYAEAEASYRSSVEKTKASVAGNFNLGDALYKQKKFDDAAQKFTEIAASSGSNKQVKAQAYHNLGNSLLEAKKLEESIEAYKKSLLNNPKDDQTRYNLAYAQEKLKQQQQQDKNKDKDKKNQDKNKDQQNKDKQDQDKKDQKDQDKNDQKDQDKKDQDKKDQQGQQPQPNQLSKEDAERMLEALKNEEKNTQDKLKNKKAKGVKGRIVKDW